MRTAILSAIAAGMLGSTVIAQPLSYNCTGTDGDGADRSFWFTATQYAVFVMTDEGDEYSIDRELRANEEKFKYGVFADYGYDGYGGFVKTSVPHSVLEADQTQKDFTAYFKIAVYSELGHHATTEINAKCEPQNAPEEFAALRKQAEGYAALIPTAQHYSESEVGYDAFFSLSTCSDYCWKNERMIARAVLAGDAPVETWTHKEVTEYFESNSKDENYSSEEQAEFKAVLKAMLKDFKELKALKVGKPDSGALDIYFVGRTKEGYLVGIHTITVET